MFIGHFALGFAAKRTTPQVPLPVLFAAAQLADLLWPFLLLAGVERVTIAPGTTAFTPLDFVSYPWSHSLLTLIIWSFVFGFVYTRVTHASTKIFVVLAALVVSHWLLDVAAHRPDMPVYPGGPKVGLGLWNSVPATIAIESAMFAIGVWLYARATRARDAIGTWAFVGLVVLLAVSYAANIVSTPPPSADAIAIVGICGGAVLIGLTWWADRHRVIR
jgi:hypothetical protein